MNQPSIESQLKEQIQQFIQWYNDAVLHNVFNENDMNEVLNDRFELLNDHFNKHIKWEHLLTIDSNFEKVIDIINSVNPFLHTVSSLYSMIIDTNSKIWIQKLWRKLVILDETCAYNKLKDMYRFYDWHDGLLIFMDVLLEDKHYIQVAQQDLKKILTDYFQTSYYDKQSFDIVYATWNSTSYILQFIQNPIKWLKMIEAGVNVYNLSQVIQRFLKVVPKNWFECTDSELKSQSVLLFNEARKEAFIHDPDNRLTLEVLDEKTNESVQVNIVPGIIDQMKKIKIKDETLPKELIIELIMDLYIPIQTSLQTRFRAKLLSVFGYSEYNNQYIRRSSRKRNSIEAELPDMALFIPVVTDFVLD